MRRDGSTVLIVQDDPDLRSGLAEYLGGAGYRTEAAGTAQEALAALGRRRFDALVADWTLPGASGMELLLQARAVAPQMPVVILTGSTEPGFTRRVLELGAADVLVKPFPLRALPKVLEKCLQPPAGDGAGGAAASAAGESPGGEAAAGPPAGLEIVGDSPAMQRVRQMLRQVAPLDSTVLILGETGTGKELFARALHAASGRRHGPFVAVNAAALPAARIESELFGDGAGVLPGVRRDGHPGKFAAASGGTFFLDEVGDLPLPLQAKLLRVLQEGEVDPVGGGGPRRVDVRVVAATHRDLAAMVAEGTFRSDLYYRLNVVSLSLPPLRERPEDIPALARHFLAQLGGRYGGPERRLAGEALACLQAYAWPGNVRELRNVLEQALAFAPGDRILPAHLPPYVYREEVALVPPAPGAGPARGADGERQAIEAALARSGGNKVKAAKLLGISRASLYVKLKVHGIL